MGVATITQLRKDVLAVKDVAQKSGVATIGTTAGTAVAALTGLPWGWIAVGAGIIGLVAVGIVAYRYRDVLARKANGILNREPVKA